ncbi:MAG TPA: DUF4402 domain-containing protein [Prolixibacteraceae bacterium]|jgi:hypothetical protein
MNSSLQCLSFKKLLLPFCLFVCFGFFCIHAKAQENPPKPISVTVSVLQHLNFGTIIPNGAGGGTVTVDFTGLRTYTGQIILPATGSFCSPALFQVTSIPGTLITIMNGPPAILTAPGGTLHLTIGPSSTGSPFISTSSSTDVFIGGTLTVGDLIANPAGAYSGTFDVTFIQQ